jgi:4-amino-4-deoxy-L-arabinose transferase-like glycosyltransferase
MKTEKISQMCLIIILAFSAFIYFYKIDKESLTTDEYFTLHSTQLSLDDIISGHQKENNPNTIPPLYTVIMHFWTAIFGISAFAQRSFSALTGITCVYIVYRFARLLTDTKTGILSALFASLSFSWFYYFRMNRCYSLFIFLTILSFYVFFYFMKNKDSKLPFFLLIAVNIALIYTHYFSFFIIALEVLFSIFEWRKDKKWVGSIFLSLVWLFFAYLPWPSNFLFDLSREPILKQRIDYYTIGSQIFRIIIVLFNDFHFKWNPILTVIYLPFLIIGFKRFLKEKSEYFKYRLIYLILIFIIPFTLIYFVTRADRERYYAPFSFPLFIILAYGIQKIKKGKLKKFILPPLLLVIAAFNLIDFNEFFIYPLNENWKQAVQYIKEVPGYQNKEMVFLFHASCNPPIFAYYYWNNKVASSLIDNIANYGSYESDLSRIGARHKLYLIYDMDGEKFFEKLNSFPDNTWIWIFRYHSIFWPLNFRMQNNGRYFFHQVVLNKELPQIDLFLLKKIK